MALMITVPPGHAIRSYRCGTTAIQHLKPTSLFYTSNNIGGPCLFLNSSPGKIAPGLCTCTLPVCLWCCNVFKSRNGEPSPLFLRRIFPPPMGFYSPGTPSIRRIFPPFAILLNSKFQILSTGRCSLSHSGTYMCRLTYPVG